MSEQQITRDNSVYIQNETSIFDNPYEKEVQEDIWKHERKKTMLAIFTIGIILLISLIIGYASAYALDSDHLFDIALFPVLFFGLGLFARLQPMIAAIGALLLIIAITILNYIAIGSASLIAGWLGKAITLYFILAAFRHAKEAEAAKKKLQELG